MPAGTGVPLHRHPLAMMWNDANALLCARKWRRVARFGLRATALRGPEPGPSDRSGLHASQCGTTFLPTKFSARSPPEALSRPPWLPSSPYRACWARSAGMW